jgi:hypothetical protein
MLFALPGYQIPYIVMNRCFYLTLQALSLVEKAEPVQVQASHYAWGTNGACECKMDVKSIWIPTWHRMDHVSWLLGLFSKTISWRWPNTKPGYHGTPNAHNCWFILLYHMWKPAWIEIHWNSIWLREVTYDFTLHLRVRDHTTWFWRCVGTAFGHFSFWALTISWSRLLACVWSDPLRWLWKSLWLKTAFAIRVEHCTLM